MTGDGGKSGNSFTAEIEENPLTLLSPPNAGERIGERGEDFGSCFH